MEIINLISGASAQYNGNNEVFTDVTALVDFTQNITTTCISFSHGLRVIPLTVT